MLNMPKQTFLRETRVCGKGRKSIVNPLTHSLDFYPIVQITFSRVYGRKKEETRLTTTKVPYYIFHPLLMRKWLHGRDGRTLHVLTYIRTLLFSVMRCAMYVYVVHTYL